MQSGIVFSNFLLAVLYWPNIYGPATSPKWAFLSIALPLGLVILKSPKNFNIVNLVALLFVVWSTITLLWTINIYDGVDSFIKLVIISEAFVLGYYLSSLRHVFIGLALGLTVCSLALIFEVNLFVNDNIVSESAVLVAVGVCIYEDWFLVIGLLPAIFWYGSRAAMLSGLILFSVWLWNKSKVWILVSFAFIVTYSFSFTGKWTNYSINEHFTIWKNTIEGFTWFGNGLGSFFAKYPVIANDPDVLIRPRYAHNDFLQIVFETGLIGGLLVLVLCYYILTSKMKEKYVFLSFLVISFFTFPMHLPVSSFIAAVICGHVARNGSSLQLFIARGRMALRARYSRETVRR